MICVRFAGSWNSSLSPTGSHPPKTTKNWWAAGRAMVSKAPYRLGWSNSMLLFIYHIAFRKFCSDPAMCVVLLHMYLNAFRRQKVDTSSLPNAETKRMQRGHLNNYILLVRMASTAVRCLRCTDPDSTAGPPEVSRPGRRPWIQIPILLLGHLK